MGNQDELFKFQDEKTLGAWSFINFYEKNNSKFRIDLTYLATLICDAIVKYYPNSPPTKKDMVGLLFGTYCKSKVVSNYLLKKGAGFTTSTGDLKIRKSLARYVIDKEWGNKVCPYKK